MSAGVKKPPVAPKPKIAQPQKPAPPPVAPKPDVAPSCPSPAALKRAKPAVAPKPCLPKTPSGPEPGPATPKGGPRTCARRERSRSSEKLGALNSRNGLQAELGKADSDYIIPTCDCGRRACAHCRPADGRETARIVVEPLENLQNGGGGGVDGFGSRVSPVPRARGKTGKSQVVNASFLEQKLKDVWVQAVSANNCHAKHRPQEKTPVQNGRAGAVDRNLNPVRSAGGSGGSQSRPERSRSDEDNGNFAVPGVGRTEDVSGPAEVSVDSPEEDGEEGQFAGSHPAFRVPAAPRKPLPVPAPRKPRKAALVRQDGMEDAQEVAVQAEEKVQGPSVVRNSPFLSPKVFIHTQSVTYSRSPAANQNHSPASRGFDAEEDSALPVPPPRQESLTLGLDKHADSSRPGRPPDEEEEDEGFAQVSRAVSETVGPVEEEDEGGYGFARYPLTRSLPKQIKLNCSLPLSVATGAAFAAERSPKAAPKKPQRHSLPASGPPRKEPSEEASGGGAEAAAAAGGVCPPPRRKRTRERARRRATPRKRVPVAPCGKSAAAVDPDRAVFREAEVEERQPRRRARESPGPTPGKPRAKSFSAADLLRADGQKRSSFRKLLELKLSVKMLPKLLAKGGQTLDCTSVVETEQSVDGEWVPGRPGGACPPARCPTGKLLQPGGRGRGHLRGAGALRFSEEGQPRGGPALGNEAMIDSSEEEDDDAASSASSKGEPEPSGDRQHEIQAKKDKVVHIAKEIMSSEKVFVDVLKLLHIDFRDAVAKASRQSGKPVVEERVLNQILYYLPQLYELNRDLLRELEERVARWDDQQCLADIFVTKGPYLKMYSTYIREFDGNVALLDEQCRKNPGFAAAVRDLPAGPFRACMSPRCANLALKHYLLKPVQRIPQYQLLLTDYLKKLPEDSSDYKDTQAALSIVKEVANHANDIMKQGDNFQKLMQIQYSLNGHHEIVQPGRVFLKEGVLKKLSRKVMQPRMFFLFNDALLYTTPVQSGQFKLNNMLSLAGMKVSKPSQEAYQNELNIESVERSFILSASSATERDEWLEAISRAIEDHTRKKITFYHSKSQEEAGGVGLDSGAPLGSKAPIWIPDLRATMCMICTCEFTLTWRRHHCRACGKVVCQACSTHKHYLEYLKNQPARVCDHCFVKLQRKSDQVDSSPSGRSTGTFSSVLINSRKQKKIPAALKEVSANTENSSISGYLLRSKGNKKQWKKLWFVIKNKVLYTYAASEDVAALESQPLLGFFLREEKSGEAQKLQFKLYHKNTLFYIFKAEDVQTARRWIYAFQEAMVL
ncbi:hypothetical protein ANANG_G00310330 [Anguilla anguilla]|uniref:FYVE, RhoGEF and PH domain containing 6 n=1 Tax=Anguilla anguilla TaxID=7936 RepID=A0A9D3RHA0_ANGAN|nr:hypothetical protein ANANG_G00310330 [Anguilla anguilla]